MRDVLRAIDANLNRAREGLRVLEDYARFARDDRAIGESLKSIRNKLGEATRVIAVEAVRFRDTAHDVGTTYENKDAIARTDLRDVVIASGKRVGEALRAIEEFTKPVEPNVSRAVERIRYAFYDVERRIAATFAIGRERMRGVRLYVLITGSACAGRDPLDVARLAIEGGADAIQLREKSLDGGALVERARRLVELCRARDVIYLINDRADVAALSDADGVHVGQGDLSVRDARQIVGANKIVGVSTHNLDGVRRAIADGADYVGVGPIFKSATKPRDFVSGLDFARSVASETTLPAVAIAGITLENLDEVLATGVRAVAVTQAICAADDVAAAAREFKRRLA